MVRSLTLALCLAMGCTASPFEPPNGDGGTSGQEWVLTLTPPADPSAAPPVLALDLTSSSAAALPDPLLLVEGEPSAVSLGRLAEGTITQVLEDRRVPVVVGATDLGIRLRPRAPLAPGQRYSLVGPAGILGSFTVGADDHRPYLHRVWPPVDSTQAPRQAVYCGPSAPIDGTRVELDPDQSFGRLAPGLDETGFAGRYCVRLAIDAGHLQEVVPPAEALGFAFDPAPIACQEPPPAPADVDCSARQSPLGPGCAEIRGERLIVHPPAGDSLWFFGSSEGLHLHQVEAMTSFAVPAGALINADPFYVVVFDVAGRSWSNSFTVDWGPAQADVVINEVLANPIGPEPRQEWVELFNAGRAPAPLRGWSLRDGNGTVPLPEFELPAGEFALLVREDFDAESVGDVAPRAGVPLIRLAQLAKGGLSNSGEPLELVDSNSAVVSRFAAISAERAGVSMGRRYPYSLDDDPEAFGAHADPGASPGASNHIE